MRTLLCFVHYKATRATAWLLAPVLRVTGRRFTKASRDTWVGLVVDRVAANLRADGVTPGTVRFW